MTDKNINTNFQNKSLDDSYFIKRALVQYRRLIEFQMLNDDRKKFFKILKDVEGEIKLKVPNVNKNLLFICDTDVSRYVFLVCALKLPEFVSNRYLTLSDLCNIWWDGGTSRSGITVDNDDSLGSTQSIVDDLCCFYVDNTMTSAANNGRILSSTISVRWLKYNKKHRKLLNWVFYKGDESTLQTSFNTINTYSYFQESDPSTHQIVKLKSFRNYESGTAGVNINNLSDLY